MVGGELRESKERGKGRQEAVIVVTGAAGFIGRHLTRYLLNHTEDVVVGLDNLYRGSWEGLTPHERLVTVTADIRVADELGPVFAGAHTVFHLAGLSHVMDSIWDQDYAFSANVGGTFNVLRAARQAGVRHVVFTSSREVYGESPLLPVPETAPLTAKNPYGASKIAGEAYCRVFDSDEMHVSVVRLANVYGAGDRGRVIPIFIDRAHQGLPLVLHGGQQVIDFVSVGTVVEALWRLGRRPSAEPINVGSGKGIRLPDLAERIIRETGSDSPIEMAPARSEEVVQFVADVRRLRAVLGVEAPPDPLAELGGQIALELAQEMTLVSGDVRSS
jgi:UDP-glucose 4-epimerase